MTTVRPVATRRDTPPADAPYRDPTRPIPDRVEDLLARMTLEEKVGQLNTPLPMPAFLVAALEAQGRSATGDDPVTATDFEELTRGTFTPDIGPVGGFYLLTGTEPDLDPAGQAALHARLQHEARTATRLGIPLLQINEGFYCVMATGATIFPEGVALGSTWDPALIEEIWAAIAREARATGLHVVGTIVEPIRDPRLGRNSEAFSEDTFLTARFAEAIVRGAQGDGRGDLAAPERIGMCLQHFPGQSQPLGGLERGALDLGERAVRQVYLPVWEAVLGPGGARSVMATYVGIDGETVHGSPRYLTALLRDELGFDGVVLSEGNGFETLQYEGIVETQAEAGRLALHAGVDVNITYEQAYLGPLVEGARAGVVAGTDLDRAVRRVLELKFQLGLFDQPVDVPADTAVVHSAAHRELALTAAREGIVLLKNEGALLPLSPDLTRVAVLGPHAAEVRTMLGDRAPSNITQPVPTLVDTVTAKLGAGARVVTERGCDVVDPDPSGIAAAVEAARGADVAIVAVGERAGDFLAPNTVGESFDVSSLDLTGAQQQLIEAVHATGTPVVVVLVNGRALSTGWVAEHVPALVDAWLPGERGAEAVADVLFGDAEPGGRLPVSVPLAAGRLPAYYDHPRSKRYWAAPRPGPARASNMAAQVAEAAYAAGQAGNYADGSAGPLFPFGHGLSYTTFAYSDLAVERTDPVTGALAEVSVTVTNTGDRGGSEVVQLYVNDRWSSVTTPVQSLRGFTKLRLAPGEARRATFRLTPRDLALFGLDHRYVVEAGVFEVMVGSSSADIHLTTELVVEESLDLGTLRDLVAHRTTGGK